MSFRDDHEAALARAEALEVELARERKRTAASEAELAESEQERQRLVARLAEPTEPRSLVHETDGDPAPDPPAPDPGVERTGWIIMWILIVVFGLLFLVSLIR